MISSEIKKDFDNWLENKWGWIVRVPLRYEPERQARLEIAYGLALHQRTLGTVKDKKNLSAENYWGYLAVLDYEEEKKKRRDKCVILE